MYYHNKKINQSLNDLMDLDLTNLLINQEAYKEKYIRNPLKPEIFCNNLYKK
jgi:hypothetical protein